VRARLRRFWKRARDLWERAKNERASPGQIAWAVGIGVFSGCTPAMGVHGWVAVALATIFRLNRLWAFIGSRISSFLVLPWIILAEIQLAHRLRTGHFLTITKDDALKQAGELLLDWCLGTIPVGGALALFFGLLAYVVARARASRRKAATEAPAPDAVLTRTPAEPPPRSSESPP
jgi:uncharacterized protein (DUF2062 family)